MNTAKLVRLWLAITIVVACLIVQPRSSAAQSAAYLSATGTATTGCTAAAPCGDFGSAMIALIPGGGGRILCLDPVSRVDNVTTGSSNVTFDIDCPGGSWAPDASDPLFSYSTPAHLTLTFRNMNFTGLGFAPSAIKVLGSATLIFDNCVLANFGGPALDIEPNSAFNLVITNSRISSSGSGVLLKPATGGSIKATLDGVTITGNNGGGIKTDSTNGAVNLDIADSEISGNVGNGINLVGTANQNMLNLTRTVIAKNGVAGVQANGASAAALIDTTLLDRNASGATAVVAGGHILTYNNNRIVGSSGSGFTGSAPLQ